MLPGYGFVLFLHKQQRLTPTCNTPIRCRCVNEKMSLSPLITSCLTSGTYIGHSTLCKEFKQRWEKEEKLEEESMTKP